MVILGRDLDRDGQQVQMPVHDEQRAHHPSESTGRQHHLPPRVGPVRRGLRLAGIVHHVLARRSVGQVPEPRGAQVDQVHHLPQVLLGPDVMLQAVQEHGPFEQDIGHGVFELPPRHVLHGFIHDGHPVPLTEPIPADRAAGSAVEKLVPADEDAQQMIPIHQHIGVERLLRIRPPQPLVPNLLGELAHRGQLHVECAKLCPFHPLSFASLLPTIPASILSTY